MSCKFGDLYVKPVWISPILQMIDHEYEASADNLLSLPKGDKVMILSKQGADKGWWKGKIGLKVGGGLSMRLHLTSKIILTLQK